MKTNMGTYDKIIRLVIAMTIIVLYYTEVLTDTLGIIALLLAFVLTLTTLIGFCPLYLPFGISTCKKAESKTKK